MNIALLSATTFIASTTAIAVGLVGDTNSCGEITGWTAPVTILVTMLTPTVLAYFAGRSHAPVTEVHTKLSALRASLDAEPDTASSTYQLAAHYYELVNGAKVAIGELLAKRDERNSK